MRTSILAAFGFALCLAVSASAGMPGTDLFVVSVGRGAGANDSHWYTSGWVHNPSDGRASVTVSLLRRDQANPAPDRQMLGIAPGQTVKLGDLLYDLFGEDQVTGALRFVSTVPIVVSTRIYNLPGRDMAESQGQFMAGLPAGLAVGTGQHTDVPGITQPADESFRCNFALVETSGYTAEVRAVLYDDLGVELGAATYTLRPFEPIQRNLDHLVRDSRVDGGRLRLEVTAGAGRVLALASMVGNGTVSQDPSTLEMEYTMAGAGAGEGDITGVAAGDGLEGGGDQGEVMLSVADGGITSEMIADATITGADVDEETELAVARLQAGGQGTSSTGRDASLHVINSSSEGEAAYVQLSGGTGNTSSALLVRNAAGGTAVECSSTSHTLKATSTGLGAYAVHGDARRDQGIGVVGTSNRDDGRGVWGDASGSNGQGVVGTHGANTGVLGTEGFGVHGTSTATAAVFGDNPSEGTWAMLGSGYGAIGADDEGSIGVLAGTVDSRRCGVVGSSQGYGVYGWTDSSGATAVVGEHRSSGATGMLGTVNHGVWASNAGGTAVYADGDLVVTGEVRGFHGDNHGAPFPRPAFDSGWVSISPGQSIGLTHGIGGDVDDYVVDMTFDDSFWGVNAVFFGGGADHLGARWQGLTDERITVHRLRDDENAEQVRIRIWVIGS
jgi:hypothetical protein